MTWAAAEARAQGVEEHVEPPKPPKRGGGRPRGGFDAAIDWPRAEKLYIEGIAVPPAEGETVGTVRWPSAGEIARIVGCSTQSIFNYASKHNWKERKENFQKRVQQGIDVARADSRVRALRRPSEILDDYLSLFDQALQDRKVRYDSMADFDKAVRLRLAVEERETATKNPNSELSLEQLQAKHHALRGSESTAVDDDEAAGVTHHGEEGQGDGAGDEVDHMSDTSDATADSTQKPQVDAKGAAKKPRKTRKPSSP